MSLTFSRVDSPIVDMEIWSAVSDGFSFAISYESRTGPGLRGQTGFMASWRPLSRVNIGAVRIAGSPLATLEEAEKACAVVLDYLTEGKKT
jgi:hypothetical protein